MNNTTKIKIPLQQDSFRSWVIAVVSLLLTTTGMGALSIVPVALKPMAEELGGGRTIPSLCYTLVFVGSGLGGPLMGWVADRIGVWVAAIVAAVAIPLGAFIASRSSGPLGLYLAHGLFIGLLGNAGLLTPLIANVQRWFDRQRGLAVAVVTVGQGLAGIVWVPIIEVWIAEHGWRQTYLYFAGIAFLLLTLLGLLLRSPVPPVNAPFKASVAAGTGRKQRTSIPQVTVLSLLCVAIAGCFIAIAVPVVHLISFSTDLGVPSAEAAQIFVVMLCCTVAGRLAAGCLADCISNCAGQKIGGLRVLLLSTTALVAIMGLWFFIAAAMPNRLELLILAIVFGLIQGSLLPGFGLAVGELLPNERHGRDTGIVMLAGALAMASGAWMGGAIYDEFYSYRPAFLVGICTMLLSAGVLSILDRYGSHF